MGTIRWIFLFISVALASGATTDSPSIVQMDLTDLMNEKTSDDTNAYDGFTNKRYMSDASTKSPGLNSMRAFIHVKMAQIVGVAGGKDEKHSYTKDDFVTSIYYENRLPVRVTGTNFITVLSQKENKTSEDEPLVILANYDTDFKVGANPVEDNGSGVAALLVIGHQIAKDLEAKKYSLAHSIILAAVDVSFNKYDSHANGPVNPEDETGADNFVTKFLPNFLKDRKKLRGAIVIDSIMNYRDEPRTQQTYGMDRDYPKAYEQMAGGKFAGNFLGLVARGGDLDSELIESFEEGWEQSKKQKRGLEQSGSNSVDVADPNLIKFIHKADYAGSQSFLHFLKSDQAAFWNYHTKTGSLYPAILLTDTREFRNSTCPSSQCTGAQYYSDAVKPKNLGFAHRTTLAVYETVVKLQSGGMQVQSSIFLSVLTVIGIFYRYLLE